MLFTKKLLITVFITITMSFSLIVNAEDDLAVTANNENASSISLYESLYTSIEMDRASEVKQFVEFGADINHRYEKSKTPLMLASSKGSISVVKTLLELGADANLTSEESMNALDYAQANNNKFIIAVLQSNSNNNLTAETIRDTNIVPIDNNSDTSKITESQGIALTQINNSKISNTRFKEINGYPDISGKYTAETIAKFYECGAYNQTVEYYADESISAINKKGKFKISYSAPLLKCNGKAKFLADKKSLKGNYFCRYETPKGLKGTLRMEIDGLIEENKVSMNYKGRDTTIGITCLYDWKRTITLNN